MSWSLKLGKIAGIGVYVHWTFILLLGWVAYVYVSAGGSAADVVEGMLFIGAVFVCIVMHELGHALAARRFGIGTRDITLLPIGGVARLERMPEDPRQELLVALAGPAVTAVIAAALLAVALIAWPPGVLLNLDMLDGNFVVRVMWVNAILLAFNLLPAFPMDGGRVLRAVLHFSLDYVDATRIAARTGQVMAVLFAVLGIFTNPWLLLIAFFVYMGAQQEAHAVQIRSACQGVPVRDAMVTRFRVLAPETMLDAAVDLLVRGEQQDFPVITGERVVGVVTRQRLVDGLQRLGPEATAADVMQRDCEPVEEDEMLDHVFDRMRANACTTLPVVRHGHLTGIITLENVGEWIMLRAALGTKPRRAVDDVLRMR